MTAIDCPSPSALRVAMARAVHQILEDEPVFADRFAVASLGSAEAAKLLRQPLVHNDVASRSLRAGIVARARWAEDCLLEAVAAGCIQYAIVGAGLDTWALRMAAQLPAVRIFELDQPAMRTWKTRLYERNGWELPSSLRQFGIDLRETGTVQGLTAAGMDLDSSVSLSILGLLVYLSDEAVEREISALSRLATGSTIMLDYRVDEQQLSPMEQLMMQFTAQMMAAGGEPWHASSTPQRMAGLLGAAGFEVEEDLGPAQLNARFFAGRCDGLQIAGGGFRYLSAVKRD
ncbi:class I SAM-dependent methyltransferase [Comamonas testosteroni]|uniref:class I SAM-dependent methyltransferase n=1 Tax=Comamonas testosteroni TaxID=285 RepID=UPI0023AA4657|nr:SAM-dependent methyltransferase [Comamonas testosteroni]WEE75304.1 class I SAM-dependent methyltransferase [Comamonas testosteroni]